MPSAPRRSSTAVGESARTNPPFTFVHPHRRQPSTPCAKKRWSHLLQRLDPIAHPSNLRTRRLRVEYGHARDRRRTRSPTGATLFVNRRYFSYRRAAEFGNSPVSCLTAWPELQNNVMSTCGVNISATASRDTF